MLTPFGIMTTFGVMHERITWLITAAGLSARAACRLAGISETLIGRWKTDNIIPRTDLVYALSRVLGTTADFIFAGSGEPPTHDQIRAAVQAAQEAAARKAVAA